MWRLLSRFAWIIANGSLIVAAIILMVQVFSRYLFNYSFPWVEELARYLTIYMVLVGSALVIYEDEHPRIDFIYNLFGENGRKVLTVIFSGLTIFFLYFMIVGGWNFSSAGMVTRTPSLRVLWAYPRFALPLGGTLMLIFVLKNLYETLFKDPDRREL